MTTNKHTAHRTSSTGKQIIVTVERGTWTETIHWDGYDMGEKTHVIDRTEITLSDETGKVLASDSAIRPLRTTHKQYAEAVKRGCVGMIGSNLFLTAEAHRLIVEALAEADAAAPKTAEQIEIETAAAAKAAKAEAWRNSPQGKAEAAAMYRHEQLMREMDRPNSDL